MRNLRNLYACVINWGAYPTVIIMGIVLHEALLASAMGLHLATYVPVVAGALVITMLERYWPYRTAWWAKRGDVGDDTVYMLLVQGLLPRLVALAISGGLMIEGQAQLFAPTLAAWWPHQWPYWTQAIVMLGSADFLRYWLHRACHEWTPLWRLHAVHHAPHKLYWLNVGRFHPLEKVLQLALDALPFIMLGVSQRVLALYFVFYALNGFFQHCNINVRLGWLNYVVSGPELHRWHHSERVHESNRNYGNNLIVWDVLFGTRFLPKARQVARLGLKNRHYPMAFPSQLITPFIKGLDQG